MSLAFVRMGSQDLTSLHTGDLVGLNILGTRVVVLNSHAMIVDLLEKRGNKYSNRPTFTVLGELMGLDQVWASTCRRYTCSRVLC